MIKTEPAVRPDPVSRGDDEALPGGLQRNARLALVAALIGFGLWTIGNFLPALAWASVLAIAIWPLYERAQRRWPPGRHNVLMPTLFTLAIGILFGLPFVVLAVQGAREVQDILALYHKATTSGIAVPDWVSHLPFGGQAVEHWWSDNLANPVEKNAILQRVNRASVLQIGQNVGRAVARRIVVFFFTLMTLFFLLKDGRGVVRDLLIASQRLFGERGERIARQMVSSVHGTVDGLVLVGLGLTALAAMVPFVVTFVFAGVGILLVVQGSVGAAIAIVAIGTVLVLVADHFIRPALIGGATRLPFLWVLFGILGGVETWGIVGLFVGPALMAALILLWREFTEAPSEQGTGLAQRA